ncbi:hypothetical protein GCM10025868_20240 [Angustibacter aerolatus]|uniref:Uncharacterized protein n=1 Tax=Angustibacter aerolatus TaxID=1162965 RepID=A0ABQ6JG64_9ACTN|nr:hypothetical protein [Angustibacter aerolatus]GMA86774.1 hypothetical protein GCM10025868_20240 [Angustibacter aerolatus]
MRGASVTVGYDAHLAIGAGSFLNDGASVVCEERVEIGRDCAISWGARVLDTDVHQARAARRVRASQAGTGRAR